ncbi:MAG TPA: hypothetical protein VJG67_01975 [Candidatus Paceibacterota bacterium]
MTEEKLENDRIAGSFYGDVGRTRWVVFANGEVGFSGFYDTDSRKIKTKKSRRSRL